MIQFSGRGPVALRERHGKAKRHPEAAPKSQHRMVTPKPLRNERRIMTRRAQVHQTAAMLEDAPSAARQRLIADRAAAAQIGLERADRWGDVRAARVSSAMPTTETSEEALISRMNSLMSGGVEI